MMNWLWLLIGFPAGIAVAWYFLRYRPAAEDVAPRVRKTGPVQVKQNQPKRHAHHFFGVIVQPGSNACDAVKAIAYSRYLSEDAPRLPLPDCNRGECRCTLQPQDDRRAGYDRRGDSFSAYGNFELDRHAQKRHTRNDRRGSS